MVSEYGYIRIVNNPVPGVCNEIGARLNAATSKKQSHSVAFRSSFVISSSSDASCSVPLVNSAPISFHNSFYSLSVIGPG